jgi:hypothetical protein
MLQAEQSVFDRILPIFCPGRRFVLVVLPGYEESDDGGDRGRDRPTWCVGVTGYSQEREGLR